MKHYLLSLFKIYFRNPFTYVSFIFPLLFLIGLGNQTPPIYLFSYVINISFIITTMFIFGGSILEIRKTSFIKSISLTKINKKTIIFCNVLIATILMLLNAMFLILVTYSLTQANFFPSDWSRWSSNPIFSLFNSSIDWKNLKWFSFIVSIILTGTFLFIFSFFIVSIIKNTTTLYLFSFFYVILFTFFSFLLIPSFFAHGKKMEGAAFAYLENLRYSLPNFWTARIMSLSMSSEKVEGINLPHISKEILGFKFELDVFINNHNFVYKFLDSISDKNDLENILKDIDVLQSKDVSSLEAFEKLVTGGELKSNFFKEIIYGNNNKIDIVLNGTVSIPLLGKPIYNFDNEKFSGNLIQIIFGIQNFTGETFLFQEFISIIEKASIDNETQSWLVFLTPEKEVWKLSSPLSAFQLFYPILVSIILTLISLKRFKWSIR